MASKTPGLQFVFALGEKKLARALVIGFRHQDIGGAVQIAIVRRGRINPFLRGGNAVLFQHHHQQFCFNDRAAEKKFHADNLARLARFFTESNWVSDIDHLAMIAGSSICKRMLACCQSGAPTGVLVRQSRR